MTQYLTFLLLGLGGGAVYASLGLSLTIAHRTSGVVNFAVGSVAMYTAYTFRGLRVDGHLLNPIPGLSARIDLGEPFSLVPAMLLSLVMAGLLGALVYTVVFRHLRTAPPLAKIVGSVGVMLVIQNAVGLKTGTDPAASRPIFPDGKLVIGEISVPYDRLYFAVIVVAVGAAFLAISRYTRIGLMTRAVAESERNASLIGLSPNRIATVSWAFSFVIAGLSGILISPVVPLTPGAYTLFIIPALAAALVGRFSAVAPTILAGLCLGMAESEFALLQAKSWMPDLIRTGVAQALPVFVVLLVLVLRGNSLPGRGEITLDQLPPALAVRNPLVVAAGVLVLGTVGIFLLDGGYRAALITSSVLAMVALSVVIVTGYLGQISLAQLTLAGVSGFLLARATTDWGLPFPVAVLSSVMLAGLVGLVVAIPALRVRSLNLAVATIAAAYAIEALYFRNNKLNGGVGGGRVSGPTLFGLDLTIGSGSSFPRIQFGLMTLAVLAVLFYFVCRLRTSALGAYMLAVRSNERGASSLGIDVVRLKLLTFVLASMTAGTGGVWLAYQQTRVSSESFGTFTSILVFATVVLTGVSSPLGALLAGLASPGGLGFVVLDRNVDLGAYFEIITGAALVLTVIMHPAGVTSGLQRLLAPRRNVAAVTVNSATRRARRRSRLEAGGLT